MSCKRCVLDSEIELDLIDGVCRYCRFADSMENERRSQKLELPWIMRKTKDKGKKYDVLIGLSGGVDSSFALLKVIEQGLRPMCFSVDNLWNIPLADENMMNLVETLKVPFYRYNIDHQKFVKLQQALVDGGIKNLEVATDHILFAATYEMANKYGIKTVITGGNWATEGTMPVDYGEDARDLYWIKNIYKEMTGERLDGLPMIPLWKEQYYRLIKRIKFVPILDYYDYNKDNAIRILKERYKYKPYKEKHGESKFTKWFQDVYLYEKFGLDKRKPHLTSLIHSGQITREKAIEVLQAKPKSSEDLLQNWRTPPKRGYDDYKNSYQVRRLVMKGYKYAKRYLPNK